MDETLINVDGVSKKFCRNLKKSLWYGAQDLGRELAGRGHGGDGQLRSDEFWAVDNISFELKRGECLGLIGHNGAGKTTLLRMLNGLIKLDKGVVEIRGRVGALIALGAGFSPVLTGRENIYVNGSVLGLSKKIIESKIDKIIEFAEIGDFINAPVQTYSSGMSVRLGFAVAAVLIEPDILFLDEVLAVGDIGFTIKCLNVVRNLTNNAAVVFVSHNMQFVSLFCTRVMVMEQGRMIMDSVNPAEGIDRYYAMITNQKQESGTGDARVLDLRIATNGKVMSGDEQIVEHGCFVTVLLKIEIDKSISGAHLMISIHDEAMSPVMCSPVRNMNQEMYCISGGRYNLEIPIGLIELNSGKYSFVIGIYDPLKNMILARIQGIRSFRIVNDKKYWGYLVRPVIAEAIVSEGMM